MTSKVCHLERLASKINLLEESGLSIQSTSTKAKCQRAASLLKVGYQSKMQLPFLDLVDLRKLVNISIPKINSMVTTDYFSTIEIDFLLESRRRFKNRISAEISRNRINKDIEILAKELSELEKTKHKLSEERIKLVQEIHYYSLAINNITH